MSSTLHMGTGTKRRLLFSICLCFLTWWEQGVAHGVSDVIEEASGIVRLGEELLIVADETPGAYFRFRLGDEKGPAITIDPSRITEVNLSGGLLHLIWRRSMSWPMVE